MASASGAASTSCGRSRRRDRVRCTCTGGTNPAGGTARLPTLAELDGVTDRPLGLARVDGHLLFANSAALEAIRRGGRARGRGRRRRRAHRPGRREGRDSSRSDGSPPTCPNTTSRSCSSRPRASPSPTASRRSTRCPCRPNAGCAISRSSSAIGPGLPLDVVNYVATTDISTAMDLGLPQDRRGPPRRRIDRRSDGVRLGRLRRPRRRARAGTSSDDELAQYFHDGHLAGLQVGGARDRRRRRRAGGADPGARVPVARLAAAPALPRPASPHRALRDGEPRRDRTCRDARSRDQRAADVRRDLGFPGGLYEQGLGEERAGLDEPVPATC